MARALRRPNPYDPKLDIRRQDGIARALTKKQQWAEADTRDKQVIFMVERYTTDRLTASQLATYKQFLLPIMLRTDLSADSVRRVLPFFTSLVGPILRRGGELTVREVFDPRAIEHFLDTTGADYGDRTQSRFVSAVGQVARAYRVPGYARPFRRRPRSSRLKPYSDEVAARQYAAASRLPEPARRDVLAMLDLGYGAGARPAQAKHSRGVDVTPAGPGVVMVKLKGLGEDDPPVFRPVTGEQGVRLLATARAVGPDKHLIRPGQSREYGYETIVDLLEDADPSLGRFRIQRAADSWFTRVAPTVPVMTLIATLQLAPSSKSLIDLTADLERPDPMEAFGMLTAAPPAPFG